MSGVLVTGGANPGEGNVISGNLGVGILTGSGGGSILGNLIGVAPDGVSAMGNGSHGISTSGTIGPIVGGLTGITPGACTGACNTIRFNAGSGIHLPAENGRQQIVGQPHRRQRRPGDRSRRLGSHAQRSRGHDAAAEQPGHHHRAPGGEHLDPGDRHRSAVHLGERGRLRQRHGGSLELRGR